MANLPSALRAAALVVVAAATAAACSSSSSSGVSSSASASNPPALSAASPQATGAASSSAAPATGTTSGSTPASSSSATPGSSATVSHAGLEVHKGACVLSTKTVTAITGETFSSTRATLANNNKFHECGYTSTTFPNDSFVVEILGSKPAQCKNGQDDTTVTTKPSGCVTTTELYVNQLSAAAHVGKVAVQLTLTLGDGTKVNHVTALKAMTQLAGEIYSAVADKTYTPPSS